LRDPDLRIRIDDRTELRLLAEEDAEALFSVVEANRGHLREHLAWVDQNTGPEDTRRFIREGLAGFSRGMAIQMAVWRDGRPVGCVGTASVDRPNGMIEVGYWLARECEGTGLMHRCCVAFIDHLVRGEGLNRIVIRAALDNARSRALAERLGFVFEGVQREGYLLHGQYVDTAVYSMLSREWSEQPSDRGREPGQ
jgi:ribosomal-protein-serine acetyltransferase